jgi:hypothetical protein
MRARAGGLAATVLLALASALGLWAPRAPAATIAYPDLQVQVPTNNMYVSHPTPATTTLGFSHITWNSGAGPFEIRPSYNSATGISQGFQALYTMTSPGVWSFDHTAPIVAPMVYDTTTFNYRFPLTAFWLYNASSSGGLGSLVATSPKTQFCIEEDKYVGGVPNTPPTSKYLPATCESPNGVLGLQVGWGDEYDASDEGENIDITGLPDGKYWLRAEADPYHYIAESNASDNITDTEIQITGSVVTTLAQTHPDSTPPTVALTSPSSGPVSGNVNLTATASGPSPIRSVQFLLDGQPIGPPQTSPPYTYTWTVGSTTPGTHYLSAQATDENGFISTAPAVTIGVPFAQLGSIGIDQQVGQTGNGTVSTPSFSTSTTGEQLLAFVSSDGPTTTVSGAGLTWQLVKRANTQTGDSEIWAATAAAPLSSTTVTSTPSSSAVQQLTVVALTGAAGLGASAGAGAPNGAQSVSYPATAAGSVGFAVGNDWDNAIARTLGPGQAMLSQYLSILTGDTHWSQYMGTPSSAAGQAVTLSDTAPTADRWNLAAVEVLPSGAPPPPPPPPPPDTQAPTVSITNPTSGQVVSGAIPVAAGAHDNVAVASVQFYLDGKPLGAPVTTPPYAVNWETTTATAGAHTLSARATDTSGNVGEAAAVPVTVQNPPPPMRCLITDVQISVQGRSTVTTPAFHNAQPGELLLAFVSSDGPYGAGKQSATVSGAGLTWTLLKRANSSPGDAEIWSARAPATLTNATVTATQTATGYPLSLTVTSMEEAAGTGATVAGSAASGAPSVSLKTTAAGSLVFGVGNDWDNAIARTLGTNQVLLNQYLSTASGDTFWAQSTTVQAGPAGSTATLNDTAPTTDRWNMAAVEVQLAG